MSKKLASSLVSYHDLLKDDWKLPKGVELIYPFGQEEVTQIVSTFYTKYYNDSDRRILLLGINPGRHGAGVTGIPFTDPIRLEDVCGIPNNFHKRMELSSDFVYRLIDQFGGPDKFYRQFLISSICPLGFIANGINVNYYDDPKLEKAVYPYIIDHINDHLEMGCSNEVAFSLGKGKNFKMLQQLNKDHGFFNRVETLPHPRWIMQYRRKHLTQHLTEIVKKLTDSIG